MGPRSRSPVPFHGRKTMNPSPGFRKFLIVLASLVCVFYLTYRVFFTFNLTTPWAVAASITLYVAEAFGILNLLLFFVQVWEVNEPDPEPVLEGRTVDVYVPTYNEDPQLLRATLEACERMDYPHRTFLCDDGGTEARLNDPHLGTAARERSELLQQMCAELGITYLTRDDNRNAKAGNLNHAFERSDGEFIVVLDADHVPEPHFITRLIGYFADERMGFVQTPHAFYNFDSFQARLNTKARTYWEEGHLFYCVIQPGRNNWNASIFAGSAAMFRRSALKGVGYYAVETITEDMHTGMRMHAAGWRSAAVTERLVAGQAAPDITTFHSQRLRWGEGNLSTIFYDNPLTMKGLTLTQRFCYLGSMIHWAGGVFKLLIYLTPILMLFTGIPPVSDFTWELGAVTLIYLFISLFSLKVVGNGYGSIVNSELFSMVNFWTQCKATFHALFLRRSARFIVTSKRGRQAKHIWPFIRPQTYLIILSVLALFWGWGRLFLGISDDWFKPVIPTVWVLIHISLAYMAIRRAFWPVNRRFSIRHEVNLPVEYESAGADGPRYGITADLNETGMAFISYEPLEVGSPMRITIRGAGEVVRCKGEVRSSVRLVNASMVHGYRCGVQFQHLTPPQVDALNRVCLHFAVPRLYEQYTRGNRDTALRRAANWMRRNGVQRRNAERYRYHLPLMINTGDSEDTAYYTSTDDLSRNAASAVVDLELAPGTRVQYLMPTPLGVVRGTAAVVRNERRQYAGQSFHRATLQFDDFEGQGRNTVQSLVNPDFRGMMAPILRPEKKPPLVRMGVPILIAFLIIVPLIAAMRFFAFNFVHEDELALRKMLDQREPLSAEQASSADRIYSETMHERYPSTDRLVLLMGVLPRVNRTTELDNVTALLGQRDPENYGLRAARAQSLDKLQKYAAAEAEYQRLTAEAERGRAFGGGQKEGLFLAAARASVHAGDFSKAADRFRKVLEEDASNATARYECAGALIEMGRYEEAARLYRDATPDLRGHRLLVAIDIARNRYDEADRHAQILSQAEPANPEGQMLQADIAAARKNYRQARGLLEKILERNPGNMEVALKVGQNALGARQWADALTIFETMIERGDAREPVLRGYVDAAASVPMLPETTAHFAHGVYERALRDPIGDATFLARLSWVLQRLNEPDKSRAILDKAITLNPQDADTRESIAGQLANMQDYEKVLAFIGDDASPPARRLEVLIHLRNKDYARAVQVAQALAAQEPGSIDNQKILVDALALNGDFPQAVALLEKLQKEYPERPDLAVKYAQTLLWAKRFDAAAAQFAAIIDPDLDKRRDLWKEFINAASSAETLEPNALKLAERIAGSMARSINKDVLMLSRFSWVLVRANKFAAAKPLLDQAVALQPADPEMRRELAGVLAKAERFKEAIALLEGLKLRNDERLLLARLYSGAKEFDAAERCTREALQNEPNNKEAKVLLAEVVSWRQDFTSSIELFQQLERDYPDDETIPIRIAEVTLWAREYDQALARFQELVDKYPQQPRIWEGFARSAGRATLLNSRQVRTAQTLYERAVSSKSNDAVLLASLAWMLRRAEEPLKADSLVERALRHKPDDPAQRRELANILYELHNYKEALAMFDAIPLSNTDHFRIIDIALELHDGDLVLAHADELIKQMPKDRRARAAQAYGLSLKRRHKEALKVYEELLTEAPRDRVLYRQIADALLAVGDYPAALQRYQTLLSEKQQDTELWVRFIDAASSAPELNPLQQRLALAVYDHVAASNVVADPARLSRLAWVMFKLGEKKRSATMIDRAVAARPVDPSTRMEIAGVLSALDRPEAALAMFAGIELHLVDRKLFSDLLISAGQLVKAEEELRQMIRERPDDLELQKRYANVLTWEQKFPEARKHWEALARKAPDDVHVETMLAFTLLWGRDFASAENRFAALLARAPDDSEVHVGYVEAVAGLEPAQLSDKARANVVRIFDRVVQGPSEKGERGATFMASLGAALAKVKESERSRSAFNRAVQFAPNSRGIWRRYGESLYALGAYDDAEEVFASLFNGTQPRLPR
jgi:cellulose synthase/poly-beta-1,6-N-acetylglucosamine synthase-like glycosyltransferase/tetratricopeptide (TPR) repeat protein